MKKATKIIWIVFCVGVLLCGIGTGVSILEYASFEYGGTYEVDVGRETSTYTVEIAPNDMRPYLLEGSQFTKDAISYSDELPDNTIEWEVSCPTLWHPEFYVEKYERFSGASGFFIYRVNTLSNWFAYKDRFLQDLKNKKLSDYTYGDVNVSIHIASNLKGRVLLDEDLPYSPL